MSDSPTIEQPSMEPVTEQVLVAQKSSNTETVLHYVKAAFREPLSGRFWREVGYIAIAAPLTFIAAVFLVVHVSVGFGLSFILLGIPLLALVPLVARMFGEAQRRWANFVLREDVDQPHQFTPDAGFFGWLASAFSYIDGWRAIGYLALSIPLTAITCWATFTVLTQGVIMLTYPLWWSLFSPINYTADGIAIESGVQFGEFYFDTWPKAILLSLLGLIVFLALPWLLRGLVLLDRILIRTLLSGTDLRQRVRTLERTRANAVEDSAATLRQVERDLHDGAQARLIAVAMNIGEIKDHVVGYEDAHLQELVEKAHVNAKDAIVELRDVIKGIHPPILDSGLDAALRTLTSRNSIPTSIAVDLPVRPDQAVESIAYFCAAELLANVAKHSGARRASVDVSIRGGALWLQVADDGIGGARVGAGSGLTGLANRVETVDGTLHVNSPHGGPTVVAVQLPMRS